jgi:hypothetical protein
MGIAAAVAIAAGCGDESTPPPPPPAGSVAIAFDHVVGSQSFQLGVRNYTNAAGNHYSLHDLRYYVSNLELVRGDGTSHAVGTVHLVDAKVALRPAWQATAIPDGHYTAIRFRFGLDAATNVPSGLPTTVANLQMVWPEPLGGGYHYMLLDGIFADSTGSDQGWMAHLGRLQSTTQPTPVDPSFLVELPVTLHVAGDAHNVHIVVDVNEWFVNPHVYDFEAIGPFMMDNPDALLDLHDNGSDGVFSIGTVARVTRN